MRTEENGLPTFFLFQSDELLQYYLSNWLDACTLGVLDSAITNRAARRRWLSVLSTIQTNVFDNWCFNDASIRWLVLRDISVPKIQIDGKNKLQMRDNAIRGMSTRSLKSLDLSNCLRITDKGLSSLVHGCRGLLNIDLRGCNITDSGVSSIAHECSKLESIRLNFWKVNMLVSISYTLLSIIL
jgi:Leucine Rich repeat